MFNACVEAGVIYVPGDYCMQPDETGKVPTHCLRLSFGQVEAGSIDPGIERLAAASAGNWAAHRLVPPGSQTPIPGFQLPTLNR